MYMSAFIYPVFLSPMLQGLSCCLREKNAVWDNISSHSWSCGAPSTCSYLTPQGRCIHERLQEGKCAGNAAAEIKEGSQHLRIRISASQLQMPTLDHQKLIAVEGTPSPFSTRDHHCNCLNDYEQQ